MEIHSVAATSALSATREGEKESPTITDKKRPIHVCSAVLCQRVMRTSLAGALNSLLLLVAACYFICFNPATMARAALRGTLHSYFERYQQAWAASPYVMTSGQHGDRSIGPVDMHHFCFYHKGISCRERATLHVYVYYRQESSLHRLHATLVCGPLYVFFA